MSDLQSTETQLNSFSFGATVKTRIETGDLDVLGEDLPGVSTITLVSRDFISYDECIGSCKKLMDDFLERFSSISEKYKMGSEVNPLYSGQATLSKDWAPGEVARLWIYDREMEKAGQIHAIGLARIFGSVRSTIDQPN